MLEKHVGRRKVVDERGEVVKKRTVWTTISERNEMLQHMRQRMMRILTDTEKESKTDEVETVIRKEEETL